MDACGHMKDNTPTDTDIHASIHMSTRGRGQGPGAGSPNTAASPFARRGPATCVLPPRTHQAAGRKPTKTSQSIAQMNPGDKKILEKALWDSHEKDLAANPLRVCLWVPL